VGPLAPEVASALDLYVHTFAAHQDAYVRDSRVTIKEPLTSEVVHSALVGGFAVSGYLAVWDIEKEGFFTHVGAIDFDTDTGLVDAASIHWMLADMGIPSLLEHSRRGAHLWVLCQTQISAHLMRRALSNALKLTEISDPEHVEVFPKRSANIFGVGALRLPLMKHPKTGIRYPLDGPQGRVTKLQALVTAAASSESPVGALRSLAGPEVEDRPYPRFSPPFGAYRRSQGDEPPSIVGLLAQIGVTAVPGGGVRCPFHDDQHASLNVSPDDQRVWCHAASCVLFNDGRGLGTLGLARLMRKEPSGEASHP
jgi:hypothetical protein